MQITLTPKELDEAVLLWLKEQGFSTDRYSINTNYTVGRSSGISGTKCEVELEPLPSISPSGVFQAMNLTDMDVQVATRVATSPRRFGQGHADE